MASNSWIGYETWARVFLFSKNARCYDSTNAKLFVFVVSFHSDKEGNDPIHGTRVRCFFNDFIIQLQSCFRRY